MKKKDLCENISYVTSILIERARYVELTITYMMILMGDIAHCEEGDVRFKNLSHCSSY